MGFYFWPGAHTHFHLYGHDACLTVGDLEIELCGSQCQLMDFNDIPGGCFELCSIDYTFRWSAAEFENKVFTATLCVLCVCVSVC